jgi:hypothetical protein
MRTFIQVKAGRGGATVSSHARYMSERERNPNREEPESRPIFTHDRDGLKHTATDRYLAGGARPKARSDSLLHLIISFNAHDQKELKKLERTSKSRRPKSDCPDTERQKGVGSTSDRAEILRAQVERDLPYARAVRLMMNNLEERTGRSDLRYALTVHRHTRQTHVHLLLRREHTDKKSGQIVFFDKKGLPKDFVNGRDERGKARGGLIDQSLSDALNTMIPRRQRPLGQSVRQPEPSQSVELSPEITDQFLTIELDGRKSSRNRGQNLGYRNSPTPMSSHEAQTNDSRNDTDAAQPQPVMTSLDSGHIELAPRYSTTRKQTGAETPDRQGTVSPHQPPSTLPARAAAPDENLTVSQTDQLLTPAVQLLDQILNFERFSKVLERRPNERVENYFSHASDIGTLHASQPEPAMAESIPSKRLFKPEGPDRLAAKTHPTSPITLDNSLPLHTRYGTRPQSGSLDKEESDDSSNQLGQAMTATVAAQPSTRDTEVHILHTKVHDKGHNVNFEASRKSPEKHSDKHTENIFSAPVEAARQPVEQTPAAKPVHFPISQLVKLERPDLVPVEEKQRSSPARSR